MSEENTQAEVINPSEEQISRDEIGEEDSPDGPGDESLAEEEKPKAPPLSLEELTMFCGHLQQQYELLRTAHNKLSHYVSNLHEDPAFLATVLSHINELTENKQVFFVQVYKKLSEEEQRKCYKATLWLDPEAENKNDSVHLTLEVWDQTIDSWNIIVEGDPIRGNIYDAVQARLLMDGAEHGEPHYVTLADINPTKKPEVDSKETSSDSN